jgi:hypothetical protein
LVLGKYAGLALTLAANMTIMTLAFYAVLLYTAWGIDPVVQSAWDAPAMDPALLKAIGLILIELLLVTAIALFFSTFSTPILSAALAFGLFIAGHFSTDLRNFDQVVDSPAAVRLARGLYSGAAERPVRREIAGRSRSRWPSAMADRRIRGALHGDAIDDCGVRLLAAGFQVDG